MAKPGVDSYIETPN